MPRELVAAHAAELGRVYGTSLDVIAACGGISVYELLLLLPADGGVDEVSHRRSVCGMTLNRAMRIKAEKVSAAYANREADAEAAMLAVMEAEAAGEPAP